MLELLREGTMAIHRASDYGMAEADLHAFTAGVVTKALYNRSMGEVIEKVSSHLAFFELVIAHIISLGQKLSILHE